MKKRIAITAAIALLAILSTMCFAACEQAITADEAMKLLSAQMEERKKRRPAPLKEPVHKIIPPILIRRDTTV